jgi:hypothetical protein
MFAGPDVFVLMLAKLIDQPSRKSETVSIRAKSRRREIIRLHCADGKSVTDGYIYFAAKRDYSLPVGRFDECAARLAYPRLRASIKPVRDKPEPAELPLILRADHVIVLFESG